MFKNPSFLFDIVCTVVWLLLAVRYARKGFLAASVQLGGNVFSLVGARVFSGWAAVEVFQRFLAGSFRTQIAESISAGGVVDLTGITFNAPLRVVMIEDAALANRSISCRSSSVKESSPFSRTAFKTHAIKVSPAPVVSIVSSRRNGSQNTLFP